MNEKGHIKENYQNTSKSIVNAMRDYKRMKKLGITISRKNGEFDETNQARFKKINKFLNWFEPAWNCLSQEQQLILSEFYMGNTLKEGAAIKLQFKLGYSERHIHRLKDDAKSELSFYLFES